KSLLFFQAEDGIRDFHVTGVQTCALPISPSDRATLLAREVIQNSWDAAIELQRTDDNAPQFEIEFEYRDLTGDARRAAMEAMDQIGRARVGKEWRSSGAAQRVTTEAGGEQ